MTRKTMDGLTADEARLLMTFSEEELARLSPSERRFLATTFSEPLEDTVPDDLDIGTPQEYRGRLFKRITKVVVNAHLETVSRRKTSLRRMAKHWLLKHSPHRY